MWEIIRDIAILALCAGYGAVCLAAVAFWLWRTWVASREANAAKASGLPPFGRGKVFSPAASAERQAGA